jgi:hypothetical protein
MGDDVIRQLRQRADEARKAILRDAGYSATKKNVLTALIGHLNGDRLSRNFGLMWPAPETVANEVGCCVRTVRRALRRSRERGHFVVAIAGGGGGRGTHYGRTTRYALGSCYVNSDTAVPLSVTPVSVNSDTAVPLSVTPVLPNSLKKPEEHQNEAGARANGFWQFWSEYPHKVDELAAAAAFSHEIAEGTTAEEILEGLRRYVKAKPEDRQWLNPANFLSRKRYCDRPAEQPSLLLPVKGGAASRGGAGDAYATAAIERMRRLMAEAGAA